MLDTKLKTKIKKKKKKKLHLGISYSICQRAKIKTISWKKPEDKTIYLHRSKDDNCTWLIQGKKKKKQEKRVEWNT